MSETPSGAATYVVLDIETGGLGTDKSLLTASFWICDQNLELLDKLDLRLKHDAYIVEARAMEVNRINLPSHHESAVTRDVARGKLGNFLIKHSERGKRKLVPVGKNTYFDLTHIWANLYARNSWETYCSHRVIDIGSIWQFLKLAGAIPTSVGDSLGDISDFYWTGVKPDHTAEGDAEATLECFRQMVRSTSITTPTN